MPQEKPLVLLVDDERMILETLSIKMENDYEIETAPNGAVAIKLVENHSFAAIVSDVRMPVKSGVDFLKWLSQKMPGRHPPFIFVSGFTDISTAVAFDMGASAILSKPFDYDVLIQTVRKSLMPAAEKWSYQEDTVEDLDLIEEHETTMCAQIRLGRGGMFIPMLTKFPQSFENVRFSVTIPDEHKTSLEGYGRISWVRRDSTNLQELPGVGIEFIGLKSDGIQYMQRLLSESSVQPYIPK